MKQPKYSVGQTLQLLRPTLYDETKGEVTEVEKMFKRIDKYSGHFDPDGLVTRESDIETIKLPYEFDGETLKVNYDGRIETSKLYGFAYTIKTPKMLSIYSESGLSDKLLPDPEPIQEEMVACPTCKGSKTMTTSMSVYGSKEPPKKSTIECVTCKGLGEVTVKYAEAFQKVWGKENWCSCPKDYGAYHKRTNGQDYYFCVHCDKLLQIG